MHCWHPVSKWWLSFLYSLFLPNVLKIGERQVTKKCVIYLTKKNGFQSLSLGPLERFCQKFYRLTLSWPIRRPNFVQIDNSLQFLRSAKNIFYTIFKVLAWSTSLLKNIENWKLLNVENLTMENNLILGKFSYNNFEYCADTMAQFYYKIWKIDSWNFSHWNGETTIEILITQNDF